MRAVLRALIISLLIATNSAAQADAESAVAEVRAAFLDYVDAENGADVDRIAEHYFPGTFSSFGPRGGHLSVSDLDESKEELKNSIASEIAAGREISLFTRDLKIHVYGSSAVVTGYWVGSIKSAAERVPDLGPWRFSSIWVRDGSRLEGSTSPHFVDGSSIARCRSASASSTAIAPATRTAGHGTQPDPVCPSGVSSDGPGSPDRRFGDAGDRR